MLKSDGGPRSSPAHAPLAEPLEPRTHLAASPVLHDLNPKVDGADPQPGVTIGNTLYFTAHSDLGRELWKTDGTPKGTRLVRDLAPGPDSSNPQLLIDVNGTLFFTTTESDRSSSLWMSDGTPDGTRRLFTADGNIGEARAGLGKLFFTVSGDAGADALWVTDGTESGTRTLVPDDGDWTRLLVEYRGRFLFASGFWTRGWKIHWTDGTRDGTERVPFFVGKKPMYQFMSGMGDLAVSRWFVANFIVHEGDLYLHRGHDDGYGRTTGLWRTDLKRAVQLFPNADKTVQTWKPAKAPLYFHGPDAPWWGSGGEVWRTDGTTQGTRRLKDVRPGPSDSNPKLLDGPLQPNLRYYIRLFQKIVPGALDHRRHHRRHQIPPHPRPHRQLVRRLRRARRSRSTRQAPPLRQRHPRPRPRALDQQRQIQRHNAAPRLHPRPVERVPAVPRDRQRQGRPRCRRRGRRGDLRLQRKGHRHQGTAPPRHPHRAVQSGAPHRRQRHALFRHRLA